MKRKEYIQSIGILLLAIVIGVGIALFIDHSDKKAPQATSSDLHITNGDLKVVSADSSQGSVQSNTNSSLTGVPAQSVPETANPSGSSLQNTGQISVPSSSGLQGSSSSNP